MDIAQKTFYGLKCENLTKTEYFEREGNPVLRWVVFFVCANYPNIKKVNIL